MPLLLTAEQAQDYPTLAAAPEDQRDQLLADVAELRSRVAATPLISEDELRARWDRGADRFDRALQLAHELGVVLGVPDRGAQEFARVPTPPHLEGLPLEDLQHLARIFNVPDRSKMTKPALVAALSAISRGGTVPATPTAVEPPGGSIAGPPRTR
jgi:hypothetical protein